MFINHLFAFIRLLSSIDIVAQSVDFKEPASALSSGWTTGRRVSELLISPETSNSQITIKRLVYRHDPAWP